LSLLFVVALEFSKRDGTHFTGAPTFFDIAAAMIRKSPVVLLPNMPPAAALELAPRESLQVISDRGIPK